MRDYYYENRASRGTTLVTLPEHGVRAEANPGESMSASYGTGGTLATGATGAGQARRVQMGDLGSQVGIMRNLEYSAGSRSHRISTGPYTSA